MMIWPLLGILKAEGKAKFNVQRLARKREAEKGGISSRLKARDMAVCKNENTNAVQLPWYDFVYPSLMLGLLIASALYCRTERAESFSFGFYHKTIPRSLRIRFLAHWAIKLIRYSTDLINLYIHTATFRYCLLTISISDREYVSDQRLVVSSFCARTCWRFFVCAWQMLYHERLGRGYCRGDTPQVADSQSFDVHKKKVSRSYSTSN